MTDLDLIQFAFNSIEEFSQAVDAELKKIKRLTGFSIYDLFWGWLPTTEDKSLFPSRPQGYVPDAEFNPIAERQQVIDLLVVKYFGYLAMAVGSIAFLPNIVGSTSALGLLIFGMGPILNQVSLITKKKAAISAWTGGAGTYR